MSEHSKVRRTWLTKLKHIGELASEDLDLRFNNLGHVIDLEMLRAQYVLLNRKKAVGIDKVTKMAYGVNLDRNLEALLSRIRRGTYRPKPARIVEIPKEDGSTRPLAISCFEDKLVQLAVLKVLTVLCEPKFLPCSYGGRPGIGAHDALRALSGAAYRVSSGAIVEIDVRKYFNSIPHQELMCCIEERISDRRLLGLIHKLLRAPYMNGDKAVANERGCPQGSIISPMLANIYLHKVIDKWFEDITRSHFRGDAEMVRYIDDMVFVFRNEHDAKRFYEVLPKRLKKFGLELHDGKSSLIKCGRVYARRASERGDKIPTFKFLGFVAYWGKSRNGVNWRLKYSSRGDRFAMKLRGMRDYLWRNRATNDRGYLLWRCVKVIRGWINYHGISDNSRRVKAFIVCAKRLLFRWFNRRGGRKRMTWDRFVRILVRVKFPERWKTVSMFARRTKI